MTTRFMCSLVVINAIKQDILPTLGDQVPDIVWDPTMALVARIEKGERADGLLATDEAIYLLAAKGYIDETSVVPLAQAKFGIAVSRDLPPPKLETQDDLVRLLKQVPSIAYSRAGASGIYFEKLIDRLGIGEEVRAKSIVIPAGLTGEKVRDGSAVLAIQQMSELLAVDGIQMVGPLPPECQQPTDFSLAIFKNAIDRAGAAAFIYALRTPQARAAYERFGLKVSF